MGLALCRIQGAPMGTIYIGINQGEGPYEAAAGTSTTGKNLQIAYDDTKVTSKEQLLLNLERLEVFIGQSNFPPA